MSKNASVRVCVQRDRRCEHCTPDSEYKGTMNHSEDKWVKIKWSRSWSDFMPTVNVIFSSLLPRRWLLGWPRGRGEKRLGSTSFSHSYSALYLTAIYVVNTDAPLAPQTFTIHITKKIQSGQVYFRSWPQIVLAGSSMCCISEWFAGALWEAFSTGFPVWTCCCQAGY